MSDLKNVALLLSEISTSGGHCLEFSTHRQGRNMVGLTHAEP